MRHFCLTLAAVAIVGLTAPTRSLAQGKPVRTVSDGIIDEAKLYTEKLPAATVVVIRPFSATDADIVEGDKSKDETRKMQGEAPKLLADHFVTKLKGLGTFSDVSVLDGGAPAPAGALVVEGKFVEMDPGSQAKRIFVGYGAGKSGVKIAGTIKSADGNLLAEIEQRRVGVMSGRDSIKILEADTKAIGEDIAKFVSEWAKGKKLK
jgi:hypothetical protein